MSLLRSSQPFPYPETPASNLVSFDSGPGRPDGLIASPGRPYPTVPVDIEAVDEEVAQGLTVRSLSGLLTAAVAGFVLWHLAPKGDLSLSMMLAAPGAAVGWAVWTVRLAGASLPVWTHRIARYLLSPARYVAPALAPQSRTGGKQGRMDP